MTGAQHLDLAAYCPAHGGGAPTLEQVPYHTGDAATRRCATGHPQPAQSVLHGAWVRLELCAQLHALWMLLTWHAIYEACARLSNIYMCVHAPA